MKVNYYKKLLLLAVHLSVIYIFQTVNAATGDRTFTFVNNTNANVWIAMNGGAVGASPDHHDSADSNSTISCTINADCPSGTHCEYVSVGGPKCFWNHPVPQGNTIDTITADDYKLAPGATKTFIIPLPNADARVGAIIWSGAIAGRTGCTVNQDNNKQLLCNTANCTTGSVTAYSNANCLTGTGTAYSVGPDSPFTKPEITLSKTGNDYYDVSMVDGYNIAIKFGPTAGQSNDTAPDLTNNADKYWCTTPGNSIPTNDLPACTWEFDFSGLDDYLYYIHVTGNELNTSSYQQCTATTHCANGQQCGLIRQSAAHETHQLYCGTPVGYFMPKTICADWTTGNPPFACTTSTISPYGTVNHIYQCDLGSQSCYQDSSSGSNCCGCSDWDTINDYPTKTCSASQSNPWLTYVLTKVTPFKQACPTAYVYPFDDPSSTFQCKTTQSGVNTTNYTITFLSINNNYPSGSSTYRTSITNTNDTTSPHALFAVAGLGAILAIIGLGSFIDADIDI